MNRAQENDTSKSQARSAVVLFAVFGFIVLAVLAVLIGLILRFGNLDEFFGYVVQAALQARYNRIVEGQALWPWAFWMFLWGFVALLVFVLLVVLYTTLLERKLVGFFQIRQGPNRVGPWGLLQPFADMVKLLIKEDIVPHAADKWLHLIAPLFIFVPTLLAFVAIPFGAGTVELPQELVAPTFETRWYEWVDTEGAVERGLPGQGWVEAAVAIEESEQYHKTWWIDRELDHDPAYIAADENGIPLEERYRNLIPVPLPIKPENPSDETVYASYVGITDYGTSGKSYDVIEMRWAGTRGHWGVIELGLQGDSIDQVEREFVDLLTGIGPEIPPEERFDFGNTPPRRHLEGLFERFADSVAVNNRRFGPASMVPAFSRAEGTRASWRDLYTPDWKNICYIHGSVDREEQQASLYIFPEAVAGGPPEAVEYDLEQIDWRLAGASFRLQRVSEGGYAIEEADGTTHSLLDLNDSAQVMIGSTPVTLTLKNTQYYTIYLMGKDLGIGIVYILAVTSLGVLGIFMAGFGGNNKWSLYGAFRSVAQLMSYEVPMTLAVLGPVLMAGTLSMVELVETQRTTWFVLPQFLAFYVFLVAMTSEVNRSPFDLPEAESELVAGFHTEYSGLKFGFFFLAEYANMFLAAAVMTVLFFGGWKGPFVVPYIGEFVSSFVWFVVKCLIWLCVFIWFRATFPRFRIDQMMDYAWKVLLPIALGNVIITGYFTFSDWHFTIWRENNWRIVEQYIKPLFFNTYTNYYAIPIIAILVILFGTEIYWLYRDRRREAINKETALGGK